MKRMIFSCMKFSKKKNERMFFMMGLAIEKKNLLSLQGEQAIIPHEDDILPMEFVEFEIEHHHALCIDWYVRTSQSINLIDSAQPWIKKAKNRLQSKTLLPAASSLLLVTMNSYALKEQILTQQEKKEMKKREKQQVKERRLKSWRGKQPNH